MGTRWTQGSKTNLSFFSSCGRVLPLPGIEEALRQCIMVIEMSQQNNYESLHSAWKQAEEVPYSNDVAEILLLSRMPRGGSPRGYPTQDRQGKRMLSTESGRRRIGSSKNR